VITTINVPPFEGDPLLEHVLDDTEVSGVTAELYSEGVPGAVHIHPTHHVLLDKPCVAEQLVPPAVRRLAVHALLRLGPRDGVLVPALGVQEVVVRLGGTLESPEWREQMLLEGEDHTAID